MRRLQPERAQGEAERRTGVCIPHYPGGAARSAWNGLECRILLSERDSGQSRDRLRRFRWAVRGTHEDEPEERADEHDNSHRVER
jgi:hypothetical protein